MKAMSARVVLASAVAAAVLGFSAQAALAANVVWIGTVSNSWSEPGNWSTGTVPGATDYVYLRTGTPNDPTDMDIDGAQVGRVFYVGTTDLTVGAETMTLDRISSRFGRNVTFASGNTQVTVISGDGTTGLQVGMTFSGTGIPAGTTIASIESDTQFTISAAPTQAGTNTSRNFDAGANLTWAGNLIANSPTDAWTIAPTRTLTVLGNISGNGGLSSGGNFDGTVELKGTNTYLGRTYANTGVVRFFGEQSVSPFTTLGRGGGSGQLRFSSESGTGDFAYSVGNVIETGQANASMQVDAGGRVHFTGDWVNNGTGTRGWNLQIAGSGVAVYDIEGTVQTNGPLTVSPDILVRLHNPMGAAFAGNTDITVGNDRSTMDGTFDLMGHDFDRKIGSNNRGGPLNAGNMVNSNLAQASTVSGNFNNMGTNQGSRDFGGPGAIILTGQLRLANGAVDTGLQKIGPGAVILRTTGLLETTAGSNNPNDFFGGTVVLDHAAHNSQKISDDQLQMQNARMLVLGNNAAATSMTIGNLAIGGSSDRGYTEIDLRSGTGAATSLTFNTLTGLNDTEVLDFSVSDGGGGTPVINTSHAAGPLGANVTFNKSQWAQVSGGQVVAQAPNVVASDAGTFAGLGYDRNLDIVGNFTSDAEAEARTLRFAEAPGNELTLGAVLRLNLNNSGGGTGSAILKTAGSGPVTVKGDSAIELGTNTALAIHQHSADALSISARITGGSGTELTKVGIGELILSNDTNSWGTNSSSGIALALYEGTATVTSIADTGVNSAIGQSGTIVMGAKNAVDLTTGVVTQQPARLNYVGAGNDTNRVINLVGVAEISANGTDLLNFTSTGNVVTNAGNSGNWNDLILSGSGSGRFNGTVNLGMGDLVKREAGLWSLSSTSSVTTYGKVVVEAGTLVNDGLFGFHTDVVVKGGTLQGSGQIRGKISILEGGSIAPGNSAGILTVGSLDLQGTLVAEILGAVAGSGYDQVLSGGGVSLGATSNLELIVGYEPEDGAEFVLIANGSSDPVLGTFGRVNGMPLVGSVFDLGGYTWTLDYAGGDGNDVVAIVAIPEPGIATLLLAAATGVLALRRRQA